MKRYDTQDLSNPETYQNDPELEKLCRQTINSRFRELGYTTRAAAREAVLAGKHPEWVAGLVNDLVSNQVATTNQTADNMAFIESLTPPAGYTVEVVGGEVLIHGAYSRDLHTRIKRQGGYWDGQSASNRKCLVVPLTNAKALRRIFKNTQKTIEKENKADIVSNIKRWLGYVENAAKEGRIYQKGVDQLKGLSIKQYPEYKAQLDEYITLAEKIKKEKAEKPSYGKSWAAQRVELCSGCGLAVSVGDEVHYRYQNGSKHLEHVNCEKVRKDQERKQAEAPYRLSGGSGYGCQGWAAGGVVKSSAANLEKNYPDFLFVVEAGKRYFREDGLSFGVGDDQGYIYWARCRAATEQEAAPVKARIEEIKRKRQAKADLEKIKMQIRDNGEYPQGQHNPEGDRFFDTQDIYGGGDWFVIGAEWIWYVRNNGMDGDNWANNNVRTGGAGAIGWRVPYSVKLAEELTHLKSTLDGTIESEAQGQRLAAMIEDNNIDR